MIRPGSQNDRVLQVLADGLPHSASEIHRRAGFMRLNSRVAELRAKEGLEIVCEHVGGTGPDAYLYTLLSERDEASSTTAVGSEAAHPSNAVWVPRTSRSATHLARVPKGEADSRSESIDKIGGGSEARGSDGPVASPPPIQPPATVPMTPIVAGGQLDLFGAAA